MPSLFEIKQDVNTLRLKPIIPKDIILKRFAIMSTDSNNTIINDFRIKDFI